MSVNNPSDVGQSDACPFELIGSMESLKDAEELVRVTHIESYPIIAYE
jgi:hypothetical protein